MHIDRVKLVNFRQYKGEHEINFTPGFNLVQGPNGTGKSNLLYAIYFGFYRATKKGMVASEDFISFGEEYTEVTIDFTHLDKSFRIQRRLDRENKEQYKYSEYSEKLNEFIEIKGMGGKKALKERIEKDTGMRQMVFESIVFAEQKNYYQIVRGDKDFMDNALHVLPLTFLQKRITQMVPKKKEIETREQLYEQYKEGLGQNQGIIDQQETLIKENEKKIARVDEEINKLIKNNKAYAGLEKVLKGFDINKLITYHNDIISSMKERTKSLKQKKNFEKEHGELKSIQDKINQMDIKLEDLGVAKSNENLNLQDLKVKLGEKNSEIKNNKEIIDNLNGLSGQTECPMCKQPVTKEHLKDEVEKYQDLKIKLQEKFTELVTKIDEKSAAIKVLDDNVSNLEEEKTNLKKNEINLTSLEKSIMDRKNEIEKLKKENELALGKALNPINEIIKSYNDIFENKIPILLEAKLDPINNAYTTMEKSIELKKKEFTSEKKKLDGEKESINKQITSLKSNVSIAKKNIKDIQEKIRTLKLEYVMDQKLLLLGNVMDYLVKEFRERKVEQLTAYTMEWYNKLVAVPLFRDIMINKDNYSVSVLPMQSIVSSDDYKDVTKYASGGHETFIAIAERLALLEIFGTNFGMFDEITDNADSANATNMIMELSASGDFLDQVIAVTHFDVGREVAGNIVYIEPVINEDGSTTAWSKVKS
ncbi:MAG: AAA family ATPase [Candidatus Hodarchaeota archaeon]